MLIKIAPQIGAHSIFALLFCSAICNLKIMKASVIDFFENPVTVKSVSEQAYFVGVCFTNYTLYICYVFIVKLNEYTCLNNQSL